MAVIARANAGAIARDAIVLDFAEIARQANDILAQARDRAAELVAEAKRERERILASAREEGFNKGREEGAAKGLAEGRDKGLAEARAAQAEALETLQREWGAALDRFEGARESLLGHARTDVLALAIGVGRKVAKRMVALDDRAAVAQLEAALSMVVRPTRLLVEAHPDDLETLRAEAPALASRLAGGLHAEILASDTLSRGSCVVRTERGRIDASIETQIDRIVEALLPGGASRLAEPPEGPAPSAPDAPSSTPPRSPDATAPEPTE